MSKKNTKRPQQPPRDGRSAGKKRGYLLVGSIGLIAVLGLATVAGPWQSSLSRTRVGSLFFSPPPPLPPPGSPSKEYIYAGGRLIATEEPNPMVAPTNLIADTFSGSQINLTWTAAPGAHHYQVERAPNLGGTFTVVNANVATTSYQDTTVTSVNAYLY